VLEGEVASHVAQVAIYLQVASQGTGVVTVHNAGIAMYGLLTSTSTNVTGASCGARLRRKALSSGEYVKNCVLDIFTLGKEAERILPAARHSCT
jgi:hypothetical protein